MATRRERVVLELVDNFTSEMARAAAATALLNRELNDLSGQSVAAGRSTRATSKDVDGLAKTARSTDRDIDKLSGRLRILADVGAALGPGLVPIGAVAIPAITGLAASLGFAAVGTGVLVAAFQGMGDALDDLNKAALDPTATNLEKAQASLDALSPAAQKFTQNLRVLQPALNDLQELAAEGVLPGFADGLESALTRLPAVARVVDGFSSSLGNIGDNLGQAIEDGKVDEFLAFLADEGPDALEDFGKIVGQTSLGLANLWMAFSPLNTDFADFLVESTADFEEWSRRLSETEGFQEFVDYVRENGPQVADTLGAIGSAAVQVVQAVAPIGGPSLQILEALANTVADIADSDLGTPIFGLVAALGLLNTAYRVTKGIQTATFGGPAVAMLRGYAANIGVVTTAQERAAKSSQQLAAANSARNRTMAGAAAGLGAVALVGTGAADSIGLANTATLALAGSLAGPYGSAVGAAVGLTMDLNNILADTGRDMQQYVELLLAGTSDPAARLKLVTAELEKQKAILGSQSGFDPQRTLQTITFGAFRADPEADAAFENVKALTKVQDELQHELDVSGKTATVTADQIEKYGKATETAAERSVRLAREQEAVRETARGAAEQFLGFGKSLNDPKRSLDSFIRSINSNATSLKEFARNAETATRRGLADGLVKQLADAGPEGALRLEQLANATDTQIERANRAYRRGREGIKQYQDVADGLEPLVLDVQDKAAKETLTRIEAILDRLGVGVTVPVRVKFIKGQGPLVQPFDPLGVQTPADGGTIMPIRRAYGGTVPGVRWPYYDKVPMLAAPGEEVISNRFGQADRNRPALKAANAGATIGVVGYADGGEVRRFSSATYGGGAAPVMSPGSTLTADDIRAIVAEVRPIYGDVKIQPHNYSEFRREMDADRRRSSSDGVQR